MDHYHLAHYYPPHHHRPVRRLQPEAVQMVGDHSRHYQQEGEEHSGGVQQGEARPEEVPES